MSEGNDYLEDVEARREEIKKISDEALLDWLLAFYVRDPEVKFGSPLMEMMWEIKRAVIDRMEKKK
jgi:hypothetical protein